MAKLSSSWSIQSGIIFIFKYILGAGAGACPYFPVTWWFYSPPANELIIDPTMNISCTSGSYSIERVAYNNSPVTPVGAALLSEGVLHLFSIFSFFMFCWMHQKRSIKNS
jgi:hypothetical protein